MQDDCKSDALTETVQSDTTLTMSVHLSNVAFKCCLIKSPRDMRKVMRDSKVIKRDSENRQGVTEEPMST